MACKHRDRTVNNRAYFLNRSVVNDNGCWLWLSALSHNGYGEATRITGSLEQKTRKYTRARAHRLAYEMLVGDIPKGMVLDHLCGVRSCINPKHLEIVTSQENNSRSGSPSALNA